MLGYASCQTLSWYKQRHPVDVKESNESMRKHCVGMGMVNVHVVFDLRNTVEAGSATSPQEKCPNHSFANQPSTNGKVHFKNGSGIPLTWLSKQKSTKTQPHDECSGLCESERESALTFSILYFDNAWDAISTASCCISSLISAFLITAFRCSAISCFCCVVLLFTVVLICCSKSNENSAHSLGTI